MARFIRRLAGFLAIQLCILGLVVSFGGPNDPNHYLAAIDEKRNLLGSAHGPRLIFVGGSNVAFGINCESFAKKMNLRPVNFGLHAGLGMEFPLRLVEHAAAQGDAIVVVPEYRLLASEAYQGRAEVISQLFEQWPRAGSYFDRQQRPGIKSFLDRDGLWWLHRWVRRARIRLTRADQPGKIYVRSNFNRYGDMVGHYGHPPAISDQPSVLPSISWSHVSRAVKRLNRFHTVCTQKGARVFFCYPQIPEDQSRECQTSIALLDRFFHDSLAMPILNAPNEATYPSEFFFDSNYHLNEAGVRARSRFLLKCLRRQLRSVARSDKSQRSQAAASARIAGKTTSR